MPGHPPDYGFDTIARDRENVEADTLGKTMSKLPEGHRSSTINIQLDYDLWTRAERMAWADGERPTDWIEGAIRARLESDLTDPHGNEAAGGRKP